MITPVEVQAKVFKSGLGYDKKDVDGFLGELLIDYEELYKNNADLNEKISVLEEKLSYYKSIEKTLQKALVLAEKTAEETIEAANRERDIIIDEARLKANSIIKDAKNDVESLHNQTIELIQQYELYKAQFKQLAKTQFELLESEAFDIHIANLKGQIFAKNKGKSESNAKIQQDKERVDDVKLASEEAAVSLVENKESIASTVQATEEVEEDYKFDPSKKIQEEKTDNISDIQTEDQADNQRKTADKTDYDIEFFSLSDDE